MRNLRIRTTAFLSALAVILLVFSPAYAIKLDGTNENGEYNTNEYQTLFKTKADSGNNITLAQAFIKTEKTLCYILFSAQCDDVDENREELKNNKDAGVLITVDGETLKADLTGTDYGGYDKNKLDFNYVPLVRTGQFTIEVRINFKDGIGDGKSVEVKMIDGHGEQSAMREVAISPPEEPPTAQVVTVRSTTEKTAKPTTEKTTKVTTEKTTKATTEKTTKEKTTKPSTVRTTKEKATRTTVAKTKRETTVPATEKRQTSTKANTQKTADIAKVTTAKFKAQKKQTAETAKQPNVTQSIFTQSNAAQSVTVTYSYLTDEYTTYTSDEKDSSKTKKTVASLVSVLLVIAACVIGGVSKKEKSEEE